MSIDVVRGHRNDYAENIAASAPLSGSTNVVMLGIGNVLLGDDGVGIKLVERLKTDSAFRAVHFVDGGTLGFFLLGLVESTDALLVADAADLNEAPGTVRLFEDKAMDNFLKSSRRRSVHEVGLCDLLDMATLLGRSPKRRALLCIQPCTIDWTEDLSVPVASTFGAAAEQASVVLRKWCEG